MSVKEEENDGGYLALPLVAGVLTETGKNEVNNR